MGPAGLLHRAKHRDEGGCWSGGSEQSCERVREEESCFPVPMGSSGKALYKGGPEPSPLAGLRRTLGQLLGLPDSSSPALLNPQGSLVLPQIPSRGAACAQLMTAPFSMPGAWIFQTGLGWAIPRPGGGQAAGRERGQSVSGVGKVSRQGLTPDTTHVTNEILVSGTITCRGPRTRELRGWRWRKMKTSAKIQVSAGEPHVALPCSSGTGGRSAVRPSVRPSVRLATRVAALPLPSSLQKGFCLRPSSRSSEKG